MSQVPPNGSASPSEKAYSQRGAQPLLPYQLAVYAADGGGLAPGRYLLGERGLLYVEVCAQAQREHNDGGDADGDEVGPQPADPDTVGDGGQYGGGEYGYPYPVELLARIAADEEQPAVERNQGPVRIE